MKKKFSVAILGTGSRGCGYGSIMQQHADEFEISAVCDINAKQLEKCRKILKLNDERLFNNETKFMDKKRADVLVIATYDNMHVRQCVKALRLGYDVLLEKPISGTREELKELLAAQKETGKKVAICHELRYGPAFEKLYELLKSGVIGRLIAVDAMERVAYWHQAQAYIRLQSVHDEYFFSTILAKCSHDLDLVQHYAGARCSSVTSVGGLTFFRQENAPQDSTERCIDCPHMEECIYSAKKIYVDGWEKNGKPEFEWPYNKVSLEIPTTKEALYKGLETNCLGKCAFRCGVEKNPYVVDHQMVQMEFENGVIANLKMLFACEPGRRINLFGTHGELLLDERNESIEIMPYGEEKKTIDFKTLIEGGYGHGGGDGRLVQAFYETLTDPQISMQTALEESLECHLMGISAEESRLSGGNKIKVHQ